MDPKKIKLTRAEQKIERMIERGEMKFAPASRVREVIEAAKRPPLIRHGGARPGAGRKPLGKVPIKIQILPKTLARLRKEAASQGGLGAVIDRWAAAG